MLSQHGFLSFWICSLIRSQLVCVVSISISCISDLILTCSRIQKKASQLPFKYSPKRKKCRKISTFSPIILTFLTSIPRTQRATIGQYKRKNNPFCLRQYSYEYKLLVYGNISMNYKFTFINMSAPFLDLSILYIFLFQPICSDVQKDSHLLHANTLFENPTHCQTQVFYALNLSPFPYVQKI